MICIARIRIKIAIWQCSNFCCFTFHLLNIVFFPPKILKSHLFTFSTSPKLRCMHSQSDVAFNTSLPTIVPAYLPIAFILGEIVCEFNQKKLLQSFCPHNSSNTVKTFSSLIVAKLFVIEAQKSQKFFRAKEIMTCIQLLCH